MAENDKGMGVDLRLPASPKDAVVAVLSLSRAWRHKHADAPYAATVKEADGVLTIEFSGLSAEEVELRNAHGISLHG